MLSGSIAILGSHYLIYLNAVNCQSGDSLARGQVEAVSKEEVLRVLGMAASDIRRKLGESVSSIRKFDAPIEQATTASLEALKAYTLANRECARGAEAQAVPLFKRAIELDPNFAMAHARLGVTYGNLGQAELSIKHTQKAFELSERVSEPERLYLTDDGGATWTAQSSGTTNTLSSISVWDENTLSAVGPGGTILRTFDDGVTWTLQSSGTVNGLNGVSFVDVNTGWVVGSGVGVDRRD